MFVKPKIFGVLNITPDSFSDGGLYNSVDRAVLHVTEMIKSGVDVIDIGAESTRNEIKPDEKNHELISQDKPIELAGAELEWSRLKDILPIIIPIIKNAGKKISIDTRNSETVKKVLEFDIDIINDVSGAENSDLLSHMCNKNVHYILMHSLGVPADPKIIIDPKLDVVREIYDWFEKKITYLETNYLKRAQIIIDPGISFGKTAEQGIAILRAIDVFKDFGCKILVGHSRKSIYNLYTDVPRNQRDIETYATSIYLGTKKIEYIRVHDVKGNIRALNVAEGVF